MRRCRARASAAGDSRWCMSFFAAAFLPSAFWRSEPDAALRGFANTRSPASAWFCVELLERLDGEEHLAAHLDERRMPGALEPVRDAVDVADVLGDVLADHPVAAGRRAGEPAVLVAEADREAVDLQLAQVVDLAAGVALDLRRPRVNSSIEKTLSRLSIRSACLTGANRSSRRGRRRSASGCPGPAVRGTAARAPRADACSRRTPRRRRARCRPRSTRRAARGCGWSGAAPRPAPC